MAKAALGHEMKKPVDHLVSGDKTGRKLDSRYLRLATRIARRALSGRLRLLGC